MNPQKMKLNPSIEFWCIAGVAAHADLKDIPIIIAIVMIDLMVVILIRKLDFL